MNKFSKLITVVAFAIFVLSTSLFAQEKTSKVADAEMKAALIMMNEYLDGLSIPDKDEVNREAVRVRIKKNKAKANIINIKNRKKTYRKTTYGLYFPTLAYPIK